MIQNFKISKFQNFKISKFQNFKISKFQNSKILIFKFSKMMKYYIDLNNNGEIVEKALLKRKNWIRGANWRNYNKFLESNKWNLIWVPKVSNIYNILQFPIQSLKIINHFPNSELLTRKNNLYKTLKNSKMNYLPFTTQSIEEVKNIYRKSIDRIEKSEKSLIFLVKPGFRHSGRGIKLFEIKKNSDFIEMSKYIEELDNDYVIQEYITNPYLINRNSPFYRKFDIRINVLVDSRKNIYLCPYGFVRTSSSPYSPHLTGNDSEDFLVHITNHSIQKNNPNYNKFEEGNVLMLDDIFRFIADKSDESEKDIKSYYLTEFSKIINDCFKFVNLEEFSKILPDSSKILPDSSKNLRPFELFGFDFLIDDTGKVYLIEINTNSGLRQDNSQAEKIIEGMIEELLQICVDFKNKMFKFWIQTN